MAGLNAFYMSLTRTERWGSRPLLPCVVETLTTPMADQQAGMPQYIFTGLVLNTAVLSFCKCTRILRAEGTASQALYFNIGAGQCPDQSKSSWLRVGEIYDVLSVYIEEGKISFRIVGHEPTPALFEAGFVRLFEIIDPKIPDQWISFVMNRGDHSHSHAWSRRDFWKDFFDGNVLAVAAFEEERRKMTASVRR